MEEHFGLTWEDSTTVVQTEEVICGIENEILPAESEEFTGVEDGNVVDEEVIDHHHHVEDDGEGDASVLYLSDGNMVVVHDQTQHYNDHHQDLSASSDQLVECQVASEEIITDQWVQECAEEIVVGSEEAVGVQESGVDEYEIPLPTCQDEYTAARPYPCDFCSRRFRKKANLMNHMVAHQTDRPHGCNLCGVRYIRKCDLMNHLKIHAYIPDADGMEDEDGQQTLDEFEEDKSKKKRQTKKKKRTTKVKEEYDSYEGDDTGASSSRNYNYVDDVNMKMLEEMPPEQDVDDDNEVPKSDEYSSYMEQEHQQEVVEERYPITDPRKPFVCQHCGVGFAREKAFLSHARLHADDGDSPFECQKCGEMFWDHAQMRAHAKEKHGGDDHHQRVVDEDFEEDVDDDDEDADYSEEETKYGTFYCSTCGLSFHRQDNLRRHQRVHVKEEFVNEHEFGHVCNVCGESFQEALDLLAHAEVHARSVEHRCMICGESFQDENSLAVHVQAKHGKTLPPNTCMLCGRTCKDRKTLLKHSWEHSKEKMFACSKCAKTFHNKARLKRHMLSHRNKVVQCDVCSEEFPDGRSLMNHRHSHSSVSGRQFPCRECGKTFGSRSSQQIHIRIHTGERPYGCRFCWKAFADGGTLRKHERIHTGEKPYACAVCPRAFNQRVVLREHIRSHHSGPDPKYCNSMTPYCCSVCSDMFATSQDLILHLIHHCDLNTAMKRQPQIGPRKYKRRRKLKPHELELISTHNEDDVIDQMENPLSNTLSESEEDRGERKRKYTRRQGKKGSTTSPKEPQQPTTAITNEMEEDPFMDQYNSSTVSAAVESITTSTANSYQQVTKLTSSPSKTGKMKRTKNNDQQTSSSAMPSRPKMIHTQKTRIPIETGEDGRVRHKTRTLITRTQPAEIKSVTGERIRPRTKNVSYHILQADKLPLATFPSTATLMAMSDDQQAVAALLKEEEHLNNVAGNELIIDHDHNLSTATTTHYNGCSYEETPPEVASEQIIECEAEEEEDEIDMMEETTTAFVEMEQQKPMTTRRRTSTTRTRSTSGGSGGSKAMKNVIIGPGSKVRLIKEGMIVSKARTTSSSSRKSEEMVVEEHPECILPDYIEPEHMVIKEEIVNHHHHNTSSSFPATVKQEILDPSPLHELAEISMQHANAAAAAANTQNLYKCEMCSEVFSDRAQLLVHVPIHI